MRVENFSNIGIEYSKVRIGNLSVVPGAVQPEQSGSGKLVFNEIPDTIFFEWRYENEETLYTREIHLVNQEILTDYFDALHGFVFCVAGKDCFLFYQFDAYFEDGEFSNSYGYFSMDRNRFYHPLALKLKLF